jgi:hypothetical protein
MVFTSAAVANSNAEAATGQIKGERRQLQEVKAALASPAPPGQGEPGDVAPGDTSLALLEN